jgi:hypothetical protein
VRGAATATVVLAALAACGSASAAWTRPFDISPRGGYTVYMSDLAVDRNGDVAAIGETYTKPDGLVVYSSHDRAPFEGEEVNDSGGESPSICFDRSGATLVLSHKVDFGDAIRVYTRPRGGSFGEATILDPRPGDPYGIVTSPRGEVFAYWTGPSAGADQVRVAVRPAGSRRFGPVQDVSAAGASAGGPWIVFDRDGNALLSWWTAHGIHYSIRPHAGSFGPERVLASSARGYRDIAANGAGRVVAVWRASAGRGQQLRAAFGTVAGGFGRSRRLAAGRANRGPLVALDAGGEAVVAWRTATEPRFELRAATAPVGSSRFGASHALAKGYSEQIGVAADGRGTATIAWIDGSTLRAARHRAGRSGFRDEVVGESNVRGTSMGTTADGRTVLAWKAFAKGGTKRVKVSVARAGHSFGAVRTLERFGRADGVEGPSVASGGDGGAFVWWGDYRETADEAIWFAGSWLLP